MRRWSLLPLIVVTMLLPVTSASAATLVPLAPAGSWESPPIHAISPPGDPRLFVVERGGRVRIVQAGALEPTPFLTVPNVDTNGERGLLSIAFPPDYASTGLLYVFTVALGADTLDPGGEPGDIRVVEYRRSAESPDLADPASARLVLRQAHGGASNHNGGQLAFGPDGLLYVTIGDAANSANAQALSNDLGKILRIDPREGPGAQPFTVPPSNPFVATVGARPEIYALGLRNPYRASFAPDGDLLLPDVGQSTWEEVNVGQATGAADATTLAGANLGWPTCEGVCTPSNPSFFDPVFQYGHPPPSGETTGCAIIGGYVVRDPSFDGLSGRYLYGDACRRDLRSLDLTAAGSDPRPTGVSLPEGDVLLGFGEDSKGCAYAMTSSTAYRLAASANAGPACSFTLQGPPGGTADTTPPKLSLRAKRRQPLRRFVQVVATCNEVCALRAAGSLRFSNATASASAKLIAASRTAAPVGEVRLRLRLPKAAFKRAKRAQRRGHRVAARVKVRATDASGNTTEESAHIALDPRRRR